MLRDALQALGQNDFVEAADGKLALEKLESAHAEKTPFSLIFLDWAMPVMDGFEVLKFCRSDYRFAHTPIIMVTAEEERSNVLKAVAAGANSYIKKPINKETLHLKLKELGFHIIQKTGD